jgi:hypothetical protein
MCKDIIIDYNTKVLEKKFKIFNSYVCIPITKEKKPVISWKNLQQTPKDMFRPEHNIALLTGQINGITVIDIDILKTNSTDSDGIKIYQELINKYNQGDELDVPICITHSGGLHLYFEYDPEIITTSKINGYSIDTRNDGGLIIAPPSIGVMGPYVWKDNKSLHNTKLTSIPLWLKEWLVSEKKVKKVKNTKNNKIVKITRVIEPSKYIYIYDTDKLINLLNSLPSKYLNNYNDWITITGCLKSENLKDVWDKWSVKGTSYDHVNNYKIWESLVPVTDICYLNVIAMTNNLHIYQGMINQTIKANFLTKHADLLINEQYIDIKHFNINHFNNIVCQIIRSNCGTGKTTAVSSYIKSIKSIKSTINDKQKILSITLRVSLGYQQIRSFKDSKIIMDFYKDMTSEQLNNSDKLVIQIDSIIHLDINLWKNTIIYLDEISALLSYILTSDTLKDKRYMIFTKLYRLLKQASIIICTDADINDMVLSFFDQIDIKYYLIHNTYKTIKETRALEYQSKETLIRLIENNLLNSQNVICCFDSKKEMETIVQRLKSYCENNKLDNQLNNFLIYSSDEGDEKDFLCINEKWKNKNIFYTPKITIGVSFDNKTPRKVYLFAQNNSINSIGFIQQISRCRNISELHYYIANTYQALKYESVDDVKSHYNDMVDKFDPMINNIMDTNYYRWMTDDIKLRDLFDNHCLTMNYKTNKWMFADDVFSKLFFISEYYDNVIRSAPREQFRWLLEDKGFVIQYNKEIIDPEIDNKPDNKSDNKINYSILYSDPKTLTENEKIIYNNAIKYAKFLNVDFNSKVSKKKYQNILISEQMFIKHYAFMILFDKTNTTKEQMKKNYNIMIPNNLYTKVGLIKKLEGLLGIDTLCIDTKVDIQRFDEDVVISDNLREQIIKVFRVSKQVSEDELNNFKYWYYQLIHMYKNILGNDIVIYTEQTKNYKHYNSYSINDQVYNILNIL